MIQLNIEVPDEILLAEKTDAKGFAREMRVLSAIKLFELGRLGSGRAAELAGMSRIAFMAELDRYRVFPLAGELEDLERDLGQRNQ